MLITSNFYGYLAFWLLLSWDSILIRIEIWIFKWNMCGQAFTLSYGLGFVLTLLSSTGFGHHNHQSQLMHNNVTFCGYGKWYWPRFDFLFSWLNKLKCFYFQSLNLFIIFVESANHSKFSFLSYVLCLIIFPKED